MKWYCEGCGKAVNQGVQVCLPCLRAEGDVPLDVPITAMGYQLPPDAGPVLCPLEGGEWWRKPIASPDMPIELDDSITPERLAGLLEECFQRECGDA